jgi:hypothetical protein
MTHKIVLPFSKTNAITIGALHKIENGGESMGKMSSFLCLSLSLLFLCALPALGQKPSCGTLKAKVYILAVADTASPGPSFGPTEKTFDLSQSIATPQRLAEMHYPSNGHGGAQADLTDAECDNTLGDKTILVQFSVHEKADCGNCNGCGQGPGGGAGFYPTYTTDFSSSKPTIQIKMNMSTQLSSSRVCTATIDGGLGQDTSWAVPQDGTTLKLNPKLDEGPHQFRISCAYTGDPNDHQRYTYLACRTPNGGSREIDETVTVRIQNEK